MEGVNALTMAAQVGDVERMKTLMEGGVNVDAQGFTGEPAVVVAAGHGQASAVAFLLSAGADVNAPSMTSLTALYVAVQNGHDSVVDLILAERGEEVDLEVVESVASLTLLHAAAQNGREGEHAIRALASHPRGGKELGPLVEDERGASPLVIAAGKGENGYPAFVALMEGWGADVDGKGYTHPQMAKALAAAAATGGVSVVKHIVEVTRASQAEEGGGLPEMVVVGDMDMLPIHAAVRFGHTEVVSFLLGSEELRAVVGLNTAVDGVTPLAYGVRCAEAKETLKILLAPPVVDELELNAIIPRTKCSALYFALINGCVDSALALLDCQGVDLDPVFPENVGWSPVFAAAALGNKTKIWKHFKAAIADNRVDVTRLDNDGDSVADIARQNGHTRLAGTLTRLIREAKERSSSGAGASSSGPAELGKKRGREEDTLEEKEEEEEGEGPARKKK